MQIWKKNSVLTGIWVSLAALLLAGMVVWGVLNLAGIPLEGHIRFFLLAVIPNLLLYRYYFKTLQYPLTANVMLVIIFLVVFPLMFYLLRSSEIAW